MPMFASVQIGQALGQFGIKDDSTQIIVGRFDATEADMLDLQALVQGTIVSPEGVQGTTDAQSIQSLYKIQPAELDVGSLLDAVLCRIAIRDCL